MRLQPIIFIALCLCSCSVLAQEIDVEYGFNIYSIKITEKDVTFKKKNFASKVTKEKCSTNIFNDFIKKFKPLSTEKPEDQTTGSEFYVKYKIEQKNGILTPKHPFSQKLLSIPQQFDIFKLATKFRCKEKK